MRNLGLCVICVWILIKTFMGWELPRKGAESRWEEGFLTELWETPAFNDKIEEHFPEEKAVKDWSEMKKKSIKSCVSWKPKEENMSGKELGTLSNAAERWALLGHRHELGDEDRENICQAWSLMWVKRQVWRNQMLLEGWLNTSRNGERWDRRRCQRPDHEGPAIPQGSSGPLISARSVHPQSWGQTKVSCYK